MSLFILNEFYVGLNLKKLLFLLIIIISSSVFAQHRKHEIPKMLRFMDSEIHVVPSDSTNIVYFSYRIPYNRVVFVKDNSNYKAHFTLSLEVSDKNSKYVTREIKNENILADDFDETISNKQFKQGIIKFNLPDGIFKAQPIISDLNSNRELRLHPVLINVEKTDSSKYLHPIVVNENKILCENANSFQLTNFNNTIPFSESKYDLILPVKDSSINKIYVLIKSKNDTVFHSVSTHNFSSNLEFELCSNNNIVIRKGKSLSFTKNFVISNFSNYLNEGPFEIEVSTDKKFKNKKKFRIFVRWIDKPFSLMNPKQAIKDLSFIEKPSVIDKLLDVDSDKYYAALNKFWEKFDPTPKTKFNPLMEEYYWRVDYASKHFAPVSGKSGLTTDRGKIFVKYGKPFKIERSSNQYGKIIEKWIFKKPQRVFEFVDKNGTGNFSLEKS